MSETVDMVLEGILCEQCGEIVDGEETGFPRICDTCEEANYGPVK